jgi:predicted DNA-binding transcriptional regulator YafY
MDKFDRIQQLHRIFCSHRYPVTINTLADLLECTAKTVKAAIDTLRDHLNAPLIYDETKKGWSYDGNADSFELPGLWLTADELNGLATVLHILNTMDAGLLGKEIQVLQQQVEKLLAVKGVSSDDFKKVIKYLSTSKRPVISRYFATITDALIHKKQLCIHYTDYANQKTQRIISSQQLIHYQENWYLDAWCHKRDSLRSFMLSRMTKVIQLNQQSKTTSEQELSEHYQTSYGIFAGKPKHTAILMFYPPVTREVASIRWHPEQIAEWQGDNYQVAIPYNDDRELIRDILKYGNSVEVIKPAVLKNKIKRIAQSVVGLYCEW